MNEKVYVYHTDGLHRGKHVNKPATLLGYTTVNCVLAESITIKVVNTDAGDDEDDEPKDSDDDASHNFRLQSGRRESVWSSDGVQCRHERHTVPRGGGKYGSRNTSPWPLLHRNVSVQIMSNALVSF